MLKARFRILLKRCDMDLHNVPDVVAACLVLHSICICHGDSFDMEWVRDAETSLMTGNRMEEHQRVVASSMVELKACRPIQEEDVVARAQRDADVGRQGTVTNDLDFGAKRHDNIARSLYKEYARNKVQQVFGDCLSDASSSTAST
ncbi:hypothetical protein L7F22_056763 [Adiantum nelumboides]|nr:hypothetical protein [Adiantum nelumboides]